MRNIGLIIGAAILVVALGVFSAVAGLLLGPIIAFVALVALLVVGLKRRSEGKPPIR